MKFVSRASSADPQFRCLNSFQRTITASQILYYALDGAPSINEKRCARSGRMRCRDTSLDTAESDHPGRRQPHLEEIPETVEDLKTA